MDTPLFQTKLYIPQPRPELIPRPRLLEQLNKGLTCKLTLISAPAGFGKTTLVCNWLNEIRPEKGRPSHRVAWLSLDEHDNEPVRFFTYVVAALQQAAEPQLLILDDYHHIRQQDIQASLTLLLDHLPPNLHVAMTTRRDPPLPLARTRVWTTLVEIRERQLRFTNDQAAAFFQQLANLTIDKNTIQRLQTRTAGWVAGLQMAAIAETSGRTGSLIVSRSSAPARGKLLP